jgi:hypothetical protein
MLFSFLSKFKKKQPKINKFTELFANDYIIDLPESCLQAKEDGRNTILKRVDLDKMVFVDTGGDEFSVNPPLSTFLNVLCKIFHNEDFSLFRNEVDGGYYHDCVQYCLWYKGVCFLELYNTTLTFKKGFDVFTTFEKNVIKAVFSHKIHKIEDYDYKQQRESVDKELNEMLKEIK